MTPLLLLVALSAQAEDLFEAPGLFEILPVGEALGDGATPVDVQVVALRPDGSAYTGLLLKPGTRSGMASDWAEVGQGLYHFKYVPPLTRSPLQADIWVKGKSEDKIKLKATTTVPVAPALATAMSLSTNPTEALLGTTAEVPLTIQVDAITGPKTPEDLVVHATAGEIEGLVSMGLGEFRARWTLDPELGRQVAILTVADRRQPTRSYGVVGLPLSQPLDVELDDLPEGSSVLLKLDQQEFGPFEPDDKGRATVPVQVPAGTDAATQVTVVGTDIRESQVDLGLPETGLLRLLPMLPTVPADSSLSVPVRLVVFTPEGGRDSAAELQLTASAGTLAEPRHEGDGVYVSDYTPPELNEGGELLIQASLGDSELHADSITAELVPARPATLELSLSPDPLPQGAEKLEVSAHLVGASGEGLEGRTVELNPTGARLMGEVEDQGEGSYLGTMKPLGEGPVEVLGSARSVATHNPLRDLVIVPLGLWVPHDGISTNMLTVAGLDELGYPVAGVEVSLTVEAGGGQLPASITTDEHGTGLVFYTSARVSDLVVVRAEAQGIHSAAAFLQGPPSHKGLVELPTSGAADDIALHRAWAELAQKIRVERE